MMDKKQKKNLIIFGIIVGVISIITILLIVIHVPYENIEYYNEQELYEAQEPYQVQETYTDYESLKYRVLEHSYRNYFWTSGCDVWVTIQNTDDVSGYFRVDFNVRTSKGTYTTTSISHFLTSGDSYKFLVSFKGDYKQSNYDVDAPSKEVTKTKTVTKYRTITKYMDVQKSRTITKYCNLWKRVVGRC